MKKALALLLSCSFLFCVACKDKDGKKGENGKLSVSDVEIWTAGGTEKILQGKDYSTRYGDDVLTFHAFRNEKESAQIILSPSKEVKEYTLTVNALQNEAGDTLSADSFEVYNQKYILVNNVKDTGTNASVGYYPDALLPYETAVAYGENTVKAGENQGLWIVLKPSKEQKAGVYSGSFTVNAGGNSYAVPVSAEVYDYTLADQTHSKSSFMIDIEEIAWGEMNSTEEMYVKYYEYLLDHRINPQNLPGNGLQYTKLTGERLESFLDYAEKYAQDPRCSSFNIPFNIISVPYEKNGQNTSILSVDFALFEDTLRAMAQRSKESGVNLLSKAGTYFIFFDEYDMNGLEDTANYNMEKAYALNTSLSNALRSEGYAEDICNAVANMKHKLVGSLGDKLLVEQAQMVPRLEYYNNEEQRAEYIRYDENAFGENGERWWYTCGYPYNPSPTYHIEDNLISSRLLSWMMYDYGVVGNLYWDAALYAWREPVVSGTAFGNLPLQDYYGTALRYPDANGDGFLLYPGRQYGIEGPVGSVRLQSILDGNEDYDLMYALEEMYVARGVSERNIDDVMSMLYRGLYSGTDVQYKDNLLQSFDDSRALLAQLLVAGEKSGLVLERFTREDGKGKIAFSVPKTSSVKIDGETATGIENGEYTLYEVERALTENVNAIVVEVNGYTVRLNLGGKDATFAGNVLVNNVSFLPAGSGTATEQTIDGEACMTLQFNAPAAGGPMRQTADIGVQALGISNRTQKVTIRIYAEEAFQIRLLKDGSDKLLDYNLSIGWNEIVLTAEALQISSGELQSLRINILEKATASKLSIGQIHLEE